MCVCVYIPQRLYHSSVDGHLGCFHVLAIVNSAAVNIGVYVSLNYGFLRVYPVVGLPSSGIAGSYGSFIPRFFKESP